MAGNAINTVPMGEAAEELFIQPLLQDPILTELGIDIKTISKDWRMYFLPQLDNITYKKTTCGWDFQDGVDVTDKDVTPVQLAAAIKQCYQVFMNTYFADKLPYGADIGSLGPEVQGILLDLFNEAFKNDLLRILFLGDTANASPLYSPMNGIYKQLSIDANIPNYGQLTANDFTLANVEATMYGIYQLQSERLWNLPDDQKKFWVTGNVYDAWRRYQQVGNGTQVVLNASALTGNAPSTTVYYQGIELVPLRFVDRYLNRDFTSGSPAVVTDPYRVILTAPMNHRIGLDANAFDNARAWYSQDDDEYKIVASTRLAYTYGWSDMQVIAGF